MKRKRIMLLSICVISLISLAHVSGNLLDYTLTTSEGEEINLQDYNEEVFLMIAMTTECSSCKLQNSHMKEVATANPNLAILSVAIDPKIDTVSTISTYKNEQNLTWVVAIDTAGELRIRYDINNYPQTYLFDETGEIVKKWIGVVSAEDVVSEVGQYRDINELDQSRNVALDTLMHNIFFISFAILVILIYPAYKLVGFLVEK